MDVKDPNLKSKFDILNAENQSKSEVEENKTHNPFDPDFEKITCNNEELK